MNTVIPDSVTEIGKWGFYGCTGLSSIVIPDSVTEIGNKAFSGCTGLTNIVVSEGNKKYDSRDNCNAIIETESNTLLVGCKDTVIPDSVTEIGEHTFVGCTGLTSIVIPNSVTEIGKGAFMDCTGLTSIVIPDSVTEIGIAAFMDCTGLTSIVIPDSVTRIGDSAFYGCTGLTSIVIPDSVTEIEDEAIYGCTGLSSIVIPDSVTKIGKWAFDGCTGLTTASVLGPVKLMYRTFRDCTALESVTLGVGIKKLLIYDIDYDEECCAFDDCTALKTINVPAKKADYYKKRLPESLHGLIVELPAEKKAKAKKTAKKVIKGGKVEVTIQGHLEILEYCSQSLINEEESFNDNYYVTYGWSGFDSIKVGTETIKKIDSYLVRKVYFAELFKADGPHPLPVDARWRDEENVEASYIIELADDEEFDIDKIEFVEAGDAPEVFEDCRFIADHILYDGKEIVTDSLSDYSAEDMFNSPGWEGEIDEI